MSSGDTQTDDGYFNDLTRQPSLPQNGTESSPEQISTSVDAEEGGEAPRAKRVACVICRKRKLKCDGSKPKCGTCARLGHCCAYDEVRRKSGPKRGYVKELEARLAQVETQLKTKAQKRPKVTEPSPQPKVLDQFQASPLAFVTANVAGFGMDGHELMDDIFNSTSRTQNISPVPSMIPDTNTGIDDSMSWEMIGLGLEEPLPMQEAIDDLHKIYFEKVHPSMPMIHQYRYMAAMNLAPNMRPAVSLRYAMWCLAAGASDRYFNHQEIFYRRARKYAELDDMKGKGEESIGVTHAQCWGLISTYEFKMMCFPRAWTSVGKAVRLAQMMGLHRMDGAGLDVKQCLPPPRDWTEREQRRRTWWMAYCMDRYASVGTGWPMTIDEKDIMTNLPASEDSYNMSIPQETPSLDKVMTSEGASSLSPFAGVVLMAHFFGRNLIHLQRPEPDDRDHDIQGGFWKRHRSMDHTLLNTSLNLPLHLRLPAGVRNPNTVFLNMNIHTSTICLHQAAIFKAEKFNLSSTLIEQSNARCLLAASEVASIMRLISHLDVSGMNPFMAFCLFIAARVFVHFLKKSPGDQEILSSLQFLLDAMKALKRTQPITESFLTQLSLDIQARGLGPLMHSTEFSPSLPKEMVEKPLDSTFEGMRCSPLFEIRETAKNAKLDQTTLDTISNNAPYHNFSPINGEPQRTTQYSLQDFSIPSREQRQPPNAQFNTPAFSSHQSGRSWPNGPQFSPNGAANVFDTEMSDLASGPHSSSGPTLSNSNSHPPSSTTSYSSPSDREPPTSTYETSASKIAQAASTHFLAFRRPSAANHLTPPSDSELTTPPAEIPQNDQQQQQDDGSFTVPAEWHLESTGETPNLTTGMTPLGEGGWPQMLEEIGWDTAGLSPDGLAWTTTTRTESTNRQY